MYAATSGYHPSMDVKYVWMHQNRIKGNHFANLKQAYAANEFMINKKLDPCLGEAFYGTNWLKLIRSRTKILIHRGKWQFLFKDKLWLRSK